MEQSQGKGIRGNGRGISGKHGDAPRERAGHELDLREAQFALAGQTFGALGVLGGRGEVVIVNGQSRAMTLVATVGVTFGETTGPITVSIEAP